MDLEKSIQTYWDKCQEADTIKSAIDQLQMLKASLEYKAMIIRDSISGYMKSNGITQDSCAIADVFLKRGKDKVIVNIDAEALPADCQRVKIEADKVAIANRFMSGQPVDGCSIEPVYSLTIKPKTEANADA